MPRPAAPRAASAQAQCPGPTVGLWGLLGRGAAHCSLAPRNRHALPGPSPGSWLLRCRCSPVLGRRIQARYSPRPGQPQAGRPRRLVQSPQRPPSGKALLGAVGLGLGLMALGQSGGGAGLSTGLRRAVDGTALLLSASAIFRSGCTVDALEGQPQTCPASAPWRMAHGACAAWASPDASPQSGRVAQPVLHRETSPPVPPCSPHLAPTS